MNRRAYVVLGWGSSFLAASLLATSAGAVELRGRSGTRATHRLAALQVEDDMPMTEEPADVTPSSEPAPKRMQAAPNVAMPITEPAWDAGVIPNSYGGRGGLCSEGYCEECPPNDCGINCYGSWGSLEYLLWWREARRSPTLVTTTTTVVDQDVDGELGQANTRVLLGEEQYDDHLQPGGRLDIGFWLDRCKSFGVGVRVTALGDDDLNYITRSNVNEVLAVPFFNLDPTVNAEDTLLVAHPLDNTTGSINVSGHNEVYLGDIYVRIVGAKSDRYRVDIVGGYLFSRINDDMTLRTSTSTGATDIIVRDRFRTKNEYNAGTIGLLGEFDRGTWKVNLLAKVSLGNVQQTSIIDGITTIGGTPQAPLAGLFAQPSNSGTLVRDEFASVSELGVNWVYKIGCGADITLGYSVVYWSEAALAGDQMNRRIDPTQATERPAPELVSDDYWAQGFNVGLGWSY